MDPGDAALAPGLRPRAGPPAPARRALALAASATAALLLMAAIETHATPGRTDATLPEGGWGEAAEAGGDAEGTMAGTYRGLWRADAARKASATSLSRNAFVRTSEGTLVLRLRQAEANVVTGDVSLRDGYGAGISGDDDVWFYAFGVHLPSERKVHLLLATRAAAAAAASSPNHASAMAQHTRVTASLPADQLAAGAGPDYHKALRAAATEYAQSQLIFGWHPLDNMEGKGKEAVERQVFQALARANQTSRADIDATSNQTDGVDARINPMRLRRTCAFRLTLYLGGEADEDATQDAAEGNGGASAAVPVLGRRGLGPNGIPAFTKAPRESAQHRAEAMYFAAISTNQPSVHGVLSSTSCGDAIPSLAMSAKRVDTSFLVRYRTQPSRYAAFATFVAVLQGAAFAIQLHHAPSGAAASRVSLLSLGMLALADAYLSLLHLAAAVVAPYAAGAFIMVSVAYFIAFTAGSFRALAVTLRARHPESFQDWAGTRRALATLYAQFYGALLATALVVYQLRFAPRCTLLLLSQTYWIPQIALMAYEGGVGRSSPRAAAEARTDPQLPSTDLRGNGIDEEAGLMPSPVPPTTADGGTRRPSALVTPLSRRHVLLTSASRLLLLAYFTLCPTNMLNLPVDVPFFCVALACIAGQVVLMQMQVVRGARFFVPASLASHLPRRYSYRRALPSGATDCVICMTPLASPHMVAPCNHAFHEACLIRWMEVKLECPTCRRGLEPP